MSLILMKKEPDTHLLFALEISDNGLNFFGGTVDARLLGGGLLGVISCTETEPTAGNGSGNASLGLPSWKCCKNCNFMVKCIYRLSVLCIFTMK